VYYDYATFVLVVPFFFFSSRRRHTRCLSDWSSDVCSSDLVQDTLVRALRSEHLFHGGDIRSWLYTILTNLNRNRLRSLSRKPSRSEERRVGKECRSRWWADQ